MQKLLHRLSRNRISKLKTQNSKLGVLPVFAMSVKPQRETTTTTAAS
jgi:hypothetical protein